MQLQPPTEAFVERIAANLTTLGVREGGALLVHSSLRSLGRLGGAESRPRLWTHWEAMARC
jgi:aminoglycoside N3'-acetyltransferase